MLGKSAVGTSARDSVPLVFHFLFTITLSLMSASLFAQHVNERPSPGDWRYIGGDAGHTRSTPLNQINPENFENLEVEWSWSDASFGSTPPRSTPVYANGMLFTVAGARRHVVAIDPISGETLWSL